MSSAVALLAAISVAALLMLTFAMYRRQMRVPKPPALLNNDVIAFGMALIMTVALMSSMAFVAYSVMRVAHTVVGSAVIAFASHIALWAIARSIIPLVREDRAGGDEAGIVVG